MKPEKRGTLEAVEVAAGVYSVDGRLYFADEFAEMAENFKSVIIKKSEKKREQTAALI